MYIRHCAITMSTIPRIFKQERLSVAYVGANRHSHVVAYFQPKCYYSASVLSNCRVHLFTKLIYNLRVTIKAGDRRPLCREMMLTGLQGRANYADFWARSLAARCFQARSSDHEK